MTSFAILWDLLAFIASIALIAIGCIRGDEEMLAAGLICFVIAAIVLVGLMCTRSFWRGFFGVDE